MTEIELKIEKKAFDERTDGDLSLQRDLVSCFEREFRELCNTLKVSALKRDKHAVLSDLHKFKGSVGVFGFVNVTNRISEIENMLKSDFCADFDVMLSELFDSVEKHIVELKKCIY